LLTTCAVRLLAGLMAPVSMTCATLSSMINLWHQQQLQQQHSQAAQQQRRQQQQLVQLPASYVKLALCMVLLWTAMAYPELQLSGCLGDAKESAVPASAHSVVALNAAGLRAWSVAAATEAATPSSSSSKEAELEVYTLAAQRALMFTGNKLVPILSKCEYQPEQRWQAAFTQLMLSDDTMLLLLVHVALLARRLAAEGQQEQPQPQEQPQQQQQQQQQQQRAPHEQLLFAAGLGASFRTPTSRQQQQQQVAATSSKPEEIELALCALSTVSALRHGETNGVARMRQLLAEQLQQQHPAAPIDVAAVWQQCGSRCCRWCCSLRCHPLLLLPALTAARDAA
jgi:hypothetical protein